VIPEELTARPQWLIWRYGRREDKPTKIPVDPNTGGAGKVDDPATWTSYEAACAARERFRCDGVGFVFTRDDPYVGIDLDHCRDPESGRVEQQAQVIIDELATYAESSVSGSGVHLILRGTMPPGSRHRGRIDDLEVEVYETGRFFVTTGEEL
jgi:primase-polymerase (primpol)-like protein